MMGENGKGKRHETLGGCWGFCLAGRADNKSESTLGLYDLVFSQFMAYVGDVEVQEITPAMIRGYLVSLRERTKYEDYDRLESDQPLSPSTRHLHYRNLKALCNWLVAEGWLQESPMRNIRSPRVPERVISPIPPEIVQRVLKAAKRNPVMGERDYAIFATLLDTGIRAGELCGARLEDLNLEGAYLKVFGKGKRERVVPLGATLCQVLWRYLLRGRPEPAIPDINNVFLSRLGHPMTPNGLYQLTQRYRRDLGLQESINPHKWRHTFAVQYLLNNGDVFSLQRILGHKSIETTMRYVHFVKGQVQAQHRKASPLDHLGL